MSPVQYDKLQSVWSMSQSTRNGGDESLVMMPARGMSRRRCRSTCLVVLVVVTLVALAPVVSRGQTPSYPGQGPASPIPPSRITQLHDDELGVLLFQRPSSDARGKIDNQSGTFVLPQSTTALYPSPQPTLDPGAAHLAGH